LTLVEDQLITLQNITVAATALAGARRDNGVQTTGLELPLQSLLDLSAGLCTSSVFGLNRLALLSLLGVGGLLLPPTTKTGTVVCLIPLSEGSRIDLDNGGAGQGVGTDELVVGRVEDDTDNTGLAGNAFRAPGEVAGVETEGTELAVAAASADKMDTLATDTGVGGLTTLLESSLLAVVCALGTRGAALVTGVTRDTHDCGLWSGLSVASLLLGDGW